MKKRQTVLLISQALLRSIVDQPVKSNVSESEKGQMLALIRVLSKHQWFGRPFPVTVRGLAHAVTAVARGRARITVVNGYFMAGVLERAYGFTATAMNGVEFLLLERQL